VPAVVRAMTAAHQVRSGEVSCVIVGPAAEASGAPAQVASSLADARDALALARSGPGGCTQGPPVITVASLAMELHLSRLPDGEALDRMIAQLIGPLADWDLRHGTNLLGTLEAHLRHGCSPTRTAKALFLGRHSVYQRLQRIESLLGCDVNDPDMHAGLLLAACAARLRTQPRGQLRSQGSAEIGP
jgi:PucR family transcriptional regulator, purine catabolism regulatory protein